MSWNGALTNLFESPWYKLVITLTRDAYEKYYSRALRALEVIFPVIITWSCYNYHVYQHMHGRTDDMHTCIRTGGRMTCIHAYARTDGRTTYIHTCIRTDGRTDDIHAYARTDGLTTCIHTCIRTDGLTTCIHTCIHAYTRHVYIRTNTPHTALSEITGILSLFTVKSKCWVNYFWPGCIYIHTNAQHKYISASTRYTHEHTTCIRYVYERTTYSQMHDTRTIYTRNTHKHTIRTHDKCTNVRHMHQLMTCAPTPTYARHTHQGTIYATTHDIRNNAPTHIHTNSHTHKHYRD